MGYAPGDRSDTNQLWREIEEERRAKRRANTLAAVEGLAALQRAGELTYQELNGPAHLRITCGRQLVDLWPAGGLWRVVGDRGRLRKDGLPAVIRFLGVKLTG